MKKIMNWVLAATLICGTSVFTWRFCPILAPVPTPFSLRYFKTFYNWFRTADSTAVCNLL